MLPWIENQMAFFKLKEEKIIPFSLFFSESAQDDSALENTWNTSETQGNFTDYSWTLTS